VEASTGCRVFIRGKGSIKDTEKVIKMLYFVIVSHLCACVIYDILSLERFYSLLDQGASLTYLMQCMVTELYKLHATSVCLPLTFAITAMG
jgi:hypothetical protein